MNHLTKSFLSIALLLSTVSAAQEEASNPANTNQDLLSSQTANTIDTDILEMLTSDVTTFDIAQNTLLSGIILGDTAMIDSALQQGADLNVADKNGILPILRAASLGDIPIVKHLIKAGANPEAALICGIDRHLLTDDIKQKPGSQESALILALLSGAERTVKILLENGADVDARSAEGYTALQIAAAKGLENTVALLIEYGAEVNLDEEELDEPINLEPEMAKTVLDAAIKEASKIE